MNKRFVIWCLAAAGVAGLMIFGFPRLGPPRDPYLPVRTGWCLAAIVCQLGAAWYFLRNLQGFQHGLKVVYVLLSAGIVFIGIGQLQLPLLVYFDGWHSLYARAGIMLLPYLLSAVLMYLAMRKFALMMNLKTTWTRTGLVLLLGLGGTVATVALFLPLDTPLFTRAYDALIGWGEAVSVATIILAYKLRGRLAPAFQAPMTWLVISLLIIILTGVQQSWLQHFVPGVHPYRDQGWALWPVLATGMAFLWMSLTYRELTRGLAADAKLVDAVIYTAALVSRPQDIEASLERLRAVTSQLTTAGGSTDPDKLDTRQRTELINIYLDLEQYLTTREPLRQLSKDGLRLGLPDSFVKLLPGS